MDPRLYTQQQIWLNLQPKRFQRGGRPQVATTLEDFLHQRDFVAYGEHGLPKGSLAADAQEFRKLAKGSTCILFWLVRVGKVAERVIPYVVGAQRV